MPRVDHRTVDSELGTYYELAKLWRAIRRLRTPIRVPIKSGANASFTLSEQDGTVWIDQDDGSLHWISQNGVERKVTGTTV